MDICVGCGVELSTDDEYCSECDEIYSNHEECAVCGIVVPNGEDLCEDCADQVY